MTKPGATNVTLTVMIVAKALLKIYVCIINIRMSRIFLVQKSNVTITKKY